MSRGSPSTASGRSRSPEPLPSPSAAAPCSTRRRRRRSCAATCRSPERGRRRHAPAGPAIPDVPWLTERGDGAWIYGRGAGAPAELPAGETGLAIDDALVASTRAGAGRPLHRPAARRADRRRRRRCGPADLGLGRRLDERRARRHRLSRRVDDERRRADARRPGQGVRPAASSTRRRSRRPSASRSRAARSS